MRAVRRLGVVVAAVAALAGLGAVAPATAATVSSSFRCTFDIPLDSTLPGFRVDICLERTSSPGLQVHAIAWVENGTSKFVDTQIFVGVPNHGTGICWVQTQFPGVTRSCQSGWAWDFDGPNDRAVATITWWPPGQSGKVASVQSPIG